MAPENILKRSQNVIIPWENPLNTGVLVIIMC